ncbi:MAG: hypothetical protein EBZ48_04320 [Proteobacteria bacterium]|nr:hypothetical protein [Pseudomonadota bacterium]
MPLTTTTPLPLRAVRYSLASCLLLTIATTTGFGISPASAQPYEKDFSFQVSTLLPKDQIDTPYYTIDETVTNSGYLNQYSVRSQYGDQVVNGRNLLAVRLSELRALNEISKISRSSVFVDAAAKNGKAALMAPVTLGKKVVSVAQQPSQIVDTAKKIPDGVGRIFTWGVDTVGGGLSYVGKQFSSDKEKGTKSKETHNDSQSDSSKAAKIAKDQGLRFARRSSPGLAGRDRCKSWV